jgi:hypothetical protein
MPQQTINIGSVANDGTGDPLRTAFDKCNDNFNELYSAGPAGEDTITILVTDPNGDAITTGNGKTYYPVPAALNGKFLVDARAVLDTAGTGGGFLCQLRRKRSGSDVDMLSTRISIESGENDSLDAAAQPVVDDANDGVATGDRIYIDVDGVPTGGKGLVVEMTFGAAS